MADRDLLKQHPPLGTRQSSSLVLPFDDGFRSTRRTVVLASAARRAAAWIVRRASGSSENQPLRDPDNSAQRDPMDHVAWPPAAHR